MWLGLIPFTNALKIIIIIIIVQKPVDNILSLRADFLCAISEAKSPKPYVPLETRVYQATYGSEVDFIPVTYLILEN